MNQKLLKQLNNCYDAYSYYPFNSRFSSFKEKKSYFLLELSDEQIQTTYHEFIFFHFCYWHLVFPKHASKEDIINYFYSRKNG
jgi:hypothetical protein